MKLSGGLFLSALCSCVAATSKPGRVFVYDPIHPASTWSQSQPAAVSPETARLILAQRLGVSQFHTIESVEDDLIHHLNAFGGKQALLGNDKRSVAHLLVWIEGADNADEIIKDADVYSATFDIRNPPSHIHNDALVHDLTAQAEALPKKADSQRLSSEDAGVLQSIGEATTHNDFLTVLRIDLSDKAPAIAPALDALVRAATSAITVVLTPSSANNPAAHPYGTYRMPSTSQLQARRERPEKILSLASASIQPPSSQFPDLSDLEDFPTIQQSPSTPSSNNNTRIIGILPPYFPTLADCESRTNKCSGHGTCVLQHKGQRNERYVCACTPTRQHVGEDTGMESKIRTTYWGGAACQKKDISQPFWLFVAAGVLMAGLISAGIGMLYSMGSEELPSVIGAGVSGPVRK